MRLRGEDTEEALRGWVKFEIQQTTHRVYDLGKFFFSVSAGTVGALATIEKLNAVSVMDTLLIASFGVLFLSIMIAINLARPRKRQVGGEIDLLSLQAKEVRAALAQTWTWFGLWLIGAGLGILAVRQ